MSFTESKDDLDGPFRVYSGALEDVGNGPVLELSVSHSTNSVRVGVNAEGYFHLNASALSHLVMWLNHNRVRNLDNER